ncbi:hypothetical protein BDN72DRAFT_831278 [Pluteus cervinus]|uniref:Uncharacterized protein n=1 Tax=Pluteus cervinus TaxID=181527 RepID=A0ACD3BCU1_9AGAR|nr:hypothetical protein BDN72DRAFT_831278 [Pluteus cervinus]
MADTSDFKIPLPRFIQLMTTNGLSMPKAMAIAGKIYKEFNTPAKLCLLTEVKLTALGVSDKEDRRAAVKAIRKAGYSPPKRKLSEGTTDSADGPSTSASTPAPEQSVPSPKKRRKVNTTTNEFLPEPPSAANSRSFDFNEILDEEVLRTKSAVVNRAPVMTAWCTVVAERMGFKREEALSIATVYTEMNAISKGISLGLVEDKKGKGLEASREGTQPFIEIMGRRVPLFKSQDQQWCALSNGTPIDPTAAFSYITRSFRQTTPHVMGSLRLLADSFSPQELNKKGWGLYAEFRPIVNGWGKRSELKYSTILDLRSKKAEAGAKPPTSTPSAENLVKFQDSDSVEWVDVAQESLEEYELVPDPNTTGSNM